MSLAEQKNRPGYPKDRLAIQAIALKVAEEKRLAEILEQQGSPSLARIDRLLANSSFVTDSKEAYIYSKLVAELVHHRGIIEVVLDETFDRDNTLEKMANSLADINGVSGISISNSEINTDYLMKSPVPLTLAIQVGPDFDPTTPGAESFLGLVYKMQTTQDRPRAQVVLYAPDISLVPQILQPGISIA